MDFVYQEDIILAVTLEEVTKVISEKLQQQGFEVLSIIPLYKTTDVHCGQYPFGESRKRTKLVGFQAKVNKTESKEP